MTDEDVNFLLALIGDEHCSKIESIDLRNNSKYVTASILDLIAQKCLNLKKINVRRCDSISSVDIKKFKLETPKCEVVSDF